MCPVSFGSPFGTDLPVSIRVLITFSSFQLIIIGNATPPALDSNPNNPDMDQENNKQKILTTKTKPKRQIHSRYQQLQDPPIETPIRAILVKLHVS